MDNLKEIDVEIQQLLIRYLEGTISDEGLHVLQQWMEASEEHIVLFFHFREDWINAKGGERYGVEEAWGKLERRLFHPVFYKSWKFFGKIASCAAVVLLFVYFGYGVISHGRESERAASKQENIEPGTKKAILVLSSNEKIALGEDSRDTLYVGNALLKKEENTLVYEGQKCGRIEEYNRLITPRGGEYSVVLSDGTKVWLNAESELRYPVCFSGAERRVYLKGEAYFAVEKQEGCSFAVYSGKTKITVLGTEFNVRNYVGEHVAATLVRGAVKVFHEKGTECRLQPGQQAIVRDDGFEIKEVEPVYYTAWKDGYFIYDGRTLDEILKELSRWYDFTYFYQNRSLGDLTLRAKLRKFDCVDRIFEILSETGDLGFETKGKTVTVVVKSNIN